MNEERQTKVGVLYGIFLLTFIGTIACLSIVSVVIDAKALEDTPIERPVEKPKKKFWMWKRAEGSELKIEALKLASKVSGNNLDFIRLITSENQNMGHADQSKHWLRKLPSGKNEICRGDYTDCWREQSYGYCQINKHHHSEFYDERFFGDKKWQMELCYKKWTGGTTFYAVPMPKDEFYLMEYNE